ncbi:hypothetical protein AB0H57_26320 [Micromonospora sp. NPDC050686]|uniref:hypothetical protein n=1 Tax=Micromonospora sp. NPDC050686 TaxID=3154631 RepID=UPI0033E16AB4
MVTCFDGVDGLSREAAEQDVERITGQHVVAGQVHGDCGGRMAAYGCEQGVGQDLVDQSFKVVGAVEVARLEFDDGGAGEEVGDPQSIQELKRGGGASVAAQCVAEAADVAGPEGGEGRARGARCGRVRGDGAAVAQRGLNRVPGLVGCRRTERVNCPVEVGQQVARGEQSSAGDVVGGLAPWPLGGLGGRRVSR